MCITMMHGPFTVTRIDPANGNSVSLADRDDNSVTLFTEDADHCRRLAATFPLHERAALQYGEQNIRDHAEINQWIAGGAMAGDLADIELGVQSVESGVDGVDLQAGCGGYVEIHPTKPSECASCGANWQGNTLLTAGNAFGNAVCQGCGYDGRQHTPVIWHQDEERV